MWTDPKSFTTIPFSGPAHNPRTILPCHFAPTVRHAVPEACGRPARSEGSFGHAILTFDASGNNASWAWHRADDNGFTVSDSAYFVRDIVACPNRGAQASPRPAAVARLARSDVPSAVQPTHRILFTNLLFFQKRPRQRGVSSGTVSR